MHTDKHLLMDTLSDEELASVSGGAGTADNEELEKCIQDCKDRLQHMRGLFVQKCISECIKKYKD